MKFNAPARSCRQPVAVSSAPMSSAFIPRRSLAWIAFVALLFNALAPLVMQGMTQDTGYSELCTVRGIERVADNGDDSDPGMAMSGAHCPFCLAQHTPFIPVRPVVAGLTSTAGADALPPLFLHAPRPPFAWPPAQPRAPPYIA